MPKEAISNTSPIQYLYQTDCFDLLPHLYDTVVVPRGVAEELAVGRARGVSLPDLSTYHWIQIQEAPHQSILPLATDLGQGEREVLSLAVSHREAVALLDDNLARQFGKHLGIAMTGTLGVLLKAKQSGHLELVCPVLERLQQLGFWLSTRTRQAVLNQAGE